jgi:hypothetical protein
MPMSNTRPVIPVLLLLLAVLAGLASSARAVAYTVAVEARPPRIVYAEGAKVNLTVTVADVLGGIATDGTPVYFHTTLGTLPAVAYTRRGKVDVLLENTTGPGTAILTVTVGDAQRTLNVEFLGQGSAAPTAVQERPCYRLTAHHVYYSVDKRIFDLRDGATMVTPSYTVTAGALQYGLGDGVITAQGEATVTAANGQTLKAEKLRIEMNARSGVLVQVEPEIVYQTFGVPDLLTRESEAVDSALLFPLDPQPTHTWILCSRATVFPNESIQFRRPEFYLDSFNHRLYSLPYHVLDLRSSSDGVVFNSKITLASDAGLNVDFPIYYAASPSHIGSLHLRQVSKGAQYYRGSAGMQVSIEEEYLLGEHADGAFYLDDLTRPTRSLSWSHGQEFGKTRLGLTAGLDRYNSASPYSKRVGLTLSRDLGKTSLNLNSNWSQFSNSQDLYNELTASLPSLTLGRTDVSVNVNPYLGFKATLVDGSAASTSTTTTGSTSNFYQGINTGIGLPVWNFWGGSLSTNFNHEISHAQDGEVTNYFDAGTRFGRQLGRGFNSSLSYFFSISRSSKDTVQAKPSQRLGLDLNGGSARVWNTSAYSSYDLNSSTLFSSGRFTYYLPWQRTTNGDPRWAVTGTVGVTTANGGSTISDQLFSLSRDIGPYSIVLHYSPTGNTAVTGIGSGTGSRWAVELVRQSW